MDKQRALELLRAQMGALRPIQYREVNPDLDKWRRDTRVILEKVFGAESKQAKDFEGFIFFPRAFGADKAVQHERDVRAFETDKVRVVPFLESVISEVEGFWDDPEHGQAVTLDPVAVVRKVCARFHHVARQLRDRYGSRGTLEIEDEYDVQDLLHALLKIEFDDIRAEEWTPSYAGKSSRMDFLLKREQLVIEAKKTRKGLEEKEVGDELIVDIARYKGHPDCKTLVCFVYDPEGRIGNPVGLENDLSGDRDGLAVVVIVTPK